MKNIELIVGAFIINQQEEVLVISGDKWGSRYVVPGGHVEPGEELEKALLREVFEETGLTVSVEKLLGVQEAVDSSFAPGRHMVFVDYLCRSKDTIICGNDEAKRYLWVAAKKDLSVPLGEYTRKGIERYLV